MMTTVVTSERREAMPTPIVLAQFTDQGPRSLRDITHRAQENMQQAQANGVTIKSRY
jgi:uncharacterized protein with GYD domain